MPATALSQRTKQGAGGQTMQNPNAKSAAQTGGALDQKPDGTLKRPAPTPNTDPTRPVQNDIASGNQQRGGTRLSDRDSEPAKGMSVQGQADTPPVPPTTQPPDPDKTGYFHSHTVDNK
jgi:hypothetical protein